MPRAIRSHTCQWCHAQFSSRLKTPIACSRSCRAKLRMTKQGTPPWRDEENALLEQLSGNKPLEDITQAIAKLNQRSGYPARSQNAVKVQLQKQRLTAKCRDDNLTIASLAETLGVSITTVHSWKKYHNLPVRKITSRRSAISLKQFRVWAKQHPLFLAGLERDRLAWVLNDRALAEQLSQLRSNRRGDRVRIQRLDTLEIYNSLGLATKAQGVYLSPSTLVFRVRKEKAKGNKQFISGGIEWRILQETKC